MSSSASSPDRPSSPRRGRSRAVPIALAAVGVFVGISALLIAEGSSPGPLLVQAVVIHPTRPGAGSEMSVDVLGHRVLSKTSTDPHAFEREAWLWAAVPETTLELLVIGTCAYIGWRAGR